MPQINLDQKCADAGFKMAKEASIKSGNKPKDALNLLIRSLGVLQEQGVYSFFLYFSKIYNTQTMVNDSGKSLIFL